MSAHPAEREGERERERERGRARGRGRIREKEKRAPKGITFLEFQTKPRKETETATWREIGIATFRSLRLSDLHESSSSSAFVVTSFG